MTTGPPKTDGAHGEHWLSPTVLALSNATEPATPSNERGAELADVLRRTLSLQPRRQPLRVLQDLRPRARHEQGQAGAEHDQLRRSCGAR